MNSNELLINGFILTIGIMTIFISIVSFGFMVMYQIRKKVRVNNYVKAIIGVAFVIGVALVVVFGSRLDLKSLGF
ncbi:hypothetical protein [Intestinibacter sp.]